MNTRIKTKTRTNLLIKNHEKKPWTQTDQTTQKKKHTHTHARTRTFLIQSVEKIVNQHRFKEVYKPRNINEEDEATDCDMETVTLIAKGRQNLTRFLY